MTTQTVCGYVKQTLKVAGFNTTVFSVHSTRHSTSSETFMEELHLKHIRKKVGGNHRRRLQDFIIFQS